MRKLVLLLVLGLAVSAQAGILVPNGEFQMYKPDTGYTVTATFPDGNVWSNGVGDDRPVSGGSVNYGDGTTGTMVDMPGWVKIEGTGTNDLYDPSHTADGSTSYNAFGSWSGGSGAMVASAAPLTRPASPGGDYEISCWVMGAAGPYVLDLLVGGTVITPDAAVTPDGVEGSWVRASRTYSTLPAGDVTINLGIPALGGELYGPRLRMDDVCFTPEPATMTLLGLGGLALLRRRK